MGLLSVLRKARAADREARVLLVGLDAAGKSTVVAALECAAGAGAAGGSAASPTPRQVAPTLGFEIRTLELGGYRLNLWDVGGQRTLRPFWRNHYEATDALVWVVDASDTPRLPGAAAELAAVLSEERLAGAVLLVLANKQDVGGAAPPGAVAAALGLPGTGDESGEEAPSSSSDHHPSATPSLTRGRAWRVVGTAAAAGADAGGLSPAFAWLVSALDAQRGGGGGVAAGVGVGAAAAAAATAATPPPPPAAAAPVPAAG